MSEPTTPRQIRESIASKLATMPTGVDHNGRTDADRARDAATIDRTSAEPVIELEAPTYAGMKPNSAQGAAGSPVPAPAPANVLDAIRVQARKSL